jgi:hypothetical protein
MLIMCVASLKFLSPKIKVTQCCGICLTRRRRGKKLSTKLLQWGGLWCILFLCLIACSLPCCIHCGIKQKRIMDFVQLHFLCYSCSVNLTLSHNVHSKLYGRNWVT